jgi:hypothetical protein
MTKQMPYRFTRYVKINMVLTKEDIASVEDTSLYYISSYKYTGNNPYIISNLCEKDDNNKMFHPLEYNNNTVHWGCEIIRALQNDFTITIYKYAMYEEKNVFESYVNYFYTQKAKAKEDGDIAKALHYKNILNNLYGKFAQKQHNKISIVNRFDDIFDIIGDDLELLVNFTKLDESKGFVEYMNKDTKQDFSSLSRFSSYITALGRTQLHETMQHIGYENVYYCDTDSIFTTKLPSNEYLSETRLGCWKIEEVITSANFYNKKNYKYTTESNSVVSKLKGTSSKLSDEQYEMLDNGKSVEIQHNIIRRTLTGAKSISQPFSINQ